ncbi:hypothetical protein [Paenirhodobacter populi]|uniref:Uncharacterized protein n=1 Tax=Paenirhodobacter populi TaxID=2306993 RepID=A0A443IPP2_9RHOB|nr:hypothetical protein [Sinirhodobacter populi]RWR08491.1 hypothetical protein D2T33_15460 [Sinirhodobacter populi]
MTSALPARAMPIGEIPKGHLAAISFYGKGLWYFIAVDEPPGATEDRKLFFLTSPDREGEPAKHRRLKLQGGTLALSLGGGWVVTPHITDTTVRNYSEQGIQTLLDITADGVHFRGFDPEAFGYSGLVLVNTDTMEPGSATEGRTFLVSAYDLHLSKADAENGKPPFLQMKS